MTTTHPTPELIDLLHDNWFEGGGSVFHARSSDSPGVSVSVNDDGTACIALLFPTGNVTVEGKLSVEAYPRR